jgi:hypothetical protein
MPIFWPERKPPRTSAGDFSLPKYTVGAKFEGKKIFFPFRESLKALRRAGFDGFCRSIFCHTFCHTSAICRRKKGFTDANFRALHKANFGMYYGNSEADSAANRQYPARNLQNRCDKSDKRRRRKMRFGPFRLKKFTKQRKKPQIHWI